MKIVLVLPFHTFNVRKPLLCSTIKVKFVLNSNTSQHWYHFIQICILPYGKVTVFQTQRNSIGIILRSQSSGEVLSLTRMLVACQYVNSPSQAILARGIRSVRIPSPRGRRVIRHLQRVTPAVIVVVSLRTRDSIDTVVFFVHCYPY